jgi:hypothetical protein
MIRHLMAATALLATSALAAPADTVLLHGRIITADAKDSVVQALAISGGLSVSVGVSSVTTIDASTITAALGDQAKVQAGVLRVSAKAYDRIYQRSTASSGGLIAGAGAESDLRILGSTISGIGKDAEVEAGLVDLIAHRDQDFDAQAFNLAVVIGGVRVECDDLIVADHNGLVAIPRDYIQAVWKHIQAQA